MNENEKEAQEWREAVLQWLKSLDDEGISFVVAVALRENATRE